MSIQDAFDYVPRKDFLPDDVKSRADYDMPLPIGYGQTNSQPSTVRMMLEWLDVRPGQKILDIGCGSGWTCALLSHLTGKNGSVKGVEIVPELVEFAQKNCRNYPNVIIEQAKEVIGWPESAPYDRILVSAAGKKIPPELIDQLGAPGKMVIPVKHSIFIISKNQSGDLETQENPGFVFVPLV